MKHFDIGPLGGFSTMRSTAARLVARLRPRGGEARARADRFLSALADGRDIDHACAVSGLDRRQALEMRAIDRRFAAAWDAVQDARVAELEARLIGRVLEGLDRADLLSGDRSADAAIRFSTQIGMWLLETRMPERYGRQAKPAARKAADASPPSPKDGADLDSAIALTRKRMREAEERMARGSA